MCPSVKCPFPHSSLCPHSKMASSPKEPWDFPGRGPPHTELSSLLLSLDRLFFSFNSFTVRRAAQQYGLREAGDNDDWTLYWTDYSVSLERVMEMKSYQVCASPDVWYLASGGPACVTSSGRDCRTLRWPRFISAGIAYDFRLPLQKINHFPGMSEICRKDLLARNMSRMLKLFPKDFHFFPRTWCLPAE